MFAFLDFFKEKSWLQTLFGKVVLTFFKHILINFISSEQGGLIVLYLCAQLAVLYTYNCLLILIYYRLDQNQPIINYIGIVYGL